MAQPQAVEAPFISERLTWEEICERHRYEWVCLVEIDKLDDGFEVNSARVVGYGRTLAVDTASSDTVVTPDLVEELGYSVRDGERVITIRSAIGKEQGFTLRVKRFSALGFIVPDYRIHVFELATGNDIDGLLGLSFLNELNYEVRSKEGRICVERAGAGRRH